MGAALKTYSILIHDDRYAEPTLLIAGVRGEERVVEIAREKLAECPHYRAVEVFEGERALLRIEREDPA